MQKRIVLLENLIPNSCPHCGAGIVIGTGGTTNAPTVRCINERCFKRVADEALAWLIQAGIDGFDESILLAMAKNGCLKEIVDLYKVSSFEITDSINSKNHKLGQRLYAAVQASVGTMKIGQFIAGMGLPDCTETECLKLADRITSFEGIIKVLESEYTSKLLGARQADAVEWFLNKYQIIDELFRKVNPKLVKIEAVNKRLAGLSFYIAGSFSTPKERFVESIKQHGGVFKLRLTRKTSFFLLGDNPDSKVLEKSLRYKINTISENVFWRMLK